MSSAIKSSAGNVPFAEHATGSAIIDPSMSATELAFISSPSAAVRPVSWRILLQACGGNMYLHQLSLADTNNGIETFEKLKLEYQRLLNFSPYHIWDKMPIFWSPVIETAILSVNSTSDLEAQQESRQAFVTRRKLDPELTAAFHTPELLAHAKNFVKDNARFEIGTSGGASGKEVLLIGLKMNWIGRLFLVLLNLLLCIGIGGLVGTVTRDVNLGVAVTSGVAAVVACVQAVLFLVFK